MFIREMKRRGRKHPRRGCSGRIKKAGPFSHSSTMDDTLHKFRCKTCVCPKAQQGAALLLLLLITVVAASSIFVTTLRQTTTQIALDKNRQTRDALARAKEGLIGYALTYSEQQNQGQPQGFLPCPDRNGDGTATVSAGETPCGGSGLSVIGWLPWRQLGLPPLRDGDGECLWYALSGTYKNNVKTSLTSDTDGQFIVRDGSGTMVIGASASEQAIAIIFAPGAPLGGQNRNTTSTLTECASQNAADPSNQSANYLDPAGGINNATGNPPLPAAPSTFVSATTTIANFNDVLLPVTPQDFQPVYARMDRWIANRAQQCLTLAYSFPYSWTAALNSPADPLDLTADSNQRFGRVPDTPSPDPPPPGWNDDPDINVGGKCFTDVGGFTGPGWWWWDTWREMVFYAVDAAASPSGGTAALQLTGAPVPNSQFVIAVAGRKLGGQQRNDANDKANIASYLEDHNDPNMAAVSPPGPAGNILPGDERFVTTPTVAGTAFNDTLCNDAGCP